MPERRDPLDVLIIGAGLFGSIIGAHLARQGHAVTIFDAEEPYWGSGPAACLMKPSWLAKMSGKEQAAALTLLDENYGVEELTAKVGPSSVKLAWVPPSRILGDKARYVRARVRSVVDVPFPSYLLDNGDMGTAKTIIVAAGVWCNDLLDLRVPVTPQAGYAFTWPVKAHYEPRIRPYAPYKQLVSFMRAPNELWVGDGSALKPSSWTEERRMASLKRCSDFVGLQGFATQHYGVRPAIKGLNSPALVEQVQKGIWVATGGAKNGTAGAAWAALMLGKVLS